MKSLRLGRHAVTIGTAAALLAGCGGSQPPLGGPGVMPESHTVAQGRVIARRIRAAQSSYQILYSFGVGSSDGREPFAA